MFEKNMRIAYLLDFYGDLLDDHTVSVMKAYYNDDLSLSEVASDVGISRQGIRHLVKKGEELLEFYDAKLGLVERYKRLASAGEELARISAELRERGDDKTADEISPIIEIITKGS